MLQVTPHMRILVAVEPVDGRKGIDSLAQLCREKLAEDPFSGCLFLFRNRSGTTLRGLVYDGTGFFLAQKRLLLALTDFGRARLTFIGHGLAHHLDSEGL